MNFKKLAVIGVIALVVIGCVVAAGCTASVSNQTTTTKISPDGTVTSVSNDNGNVTAVQFNINDLVGTWEPKTPTNDAMKFVINSDKTGIRYLKNSEGNLVEAPFTWDTSADGIKIIFNQKDSDGKEVIITAKLGDDKKSLIDSTGLIIIKS